MIIIDKMPITEAFMQWIEARYDQMTAEERADCEARIQAMRDRIAQGVVIDLDPEYMAWMPKGEFGDGTWTQ